MPDMGEKLWIMSTQATTIQEYRRFERWNACARTSSFRDSVIASLMPLRYRSVEGLVDHGPSLDSLRRYQWSSSNTSSDQDSGKELPIYFLSPDFVDKYSSIGDPVNLQSSKPSHLCPSWHVCVRSWTSFWCLVAPPLCRQGSLASFGPPPVIILARTL